MCLKSKQWCSRLQLSLDKSKELHNYCKQLNKGGLALLFPYPTASSRLEDLSKIPPQPDRGSCQHLAEGELPPPAPGLSQRRELRGAGAAVPRTAPHSPSSFSSNTGALCEWLPPMLVHSRLRIPRRQHSAGPAVTPASGQLPSRRPSPARPGELPQG